MMHLVWSLAGWPSLSVPACIADGLRNELMNPVGKTPNGHTFLKNSETRRFQCLCNYYMKAGDPGQKL
jgi:hypothetical protein